MLAGVQSFNEGVAKAVDRYCLQHSNPLPPCLDEHKAWTAETFEFPERMSSSLQAQLFMFMASDRRARRILDVGTFSGYSALAWLQGMKNTGGEVWTLENDPKMVEASRDAIAKYDKERRVHLVPGAAIETLRTLNGPFDIIYLDAHKGENIDYLSIILERRLLSPTGIILVNDAVCRGLVADASDNNPNATDEWRVPNLRRAERVHKFNEYVIKDNRVDVVLLPAFDGLTMIKRRRGSGRVATRGRVRTLRPLVKHLTGWSGALHAGSSGCRMIFQRFLLSKKTAMSS